MKTHAGERTRFLVVGAIATLTDAGLFALLTASAVDPRLANVISYPVSAILAFWLHRRWTYRAADGAILAQALRFTLSISAGLAASTMVVWVLATPLGPLPAKALAIAASFAVNFSLFRRVVFNDRPRRAVTGRGLFPLRKADPARPRFPRSQ